MEIDWRAYGDCVSDCEATCGGECRQLSRITCLPVIDAAAMADCLPAELMLTTSSTFLRLTCPRLPSYTVTSCAAACTARLYQCLHAFAAHFVDCMQEPVGLADSGQNLARTRLDVDCLLKRRARKRTKTPTTFLSRYDHNPN
jgi:hypothetical protein